MLITDVMMPEMNGPELVDKLLSPYPDLKYMFISGSYTDDAVFLQMVEENGDYFLPKPFTFHDLSAKVREVLGKRAS